MRRLGSISSSQEKMEQTTHVCFLSFCVDPCYNPHVEPCVAAYPHFFHAFSRQIRFFWKSVEAVSAFCAPLATRCLRRKKETKKTCLLSATLAAWMNNWLSSGGRLAEAGTADFVCGISFWMVEEKPFRAVVFFFSNVRNPKWPRIFLLSFKVFEMPLPVLRLSETALSRRSADWNAARLVTLMQFCIFLHVSGKEENVLGLKIPTSVYFLTFWCVLLLYVLLRTDTNTFCPWQSWWMT